MQRIINIDFYNLYGDCFNGDAIVDYIRYDEDGNIVNEIIAIALPEFAMNNLKDEITTRFHNGEGYTL